LQAVGRLRNSGRSGSHPSPAPWRRGGCIAPSSSGATSRTSRERPARRWPARLKQA
jgi:hypothetical protein